MHQYLTPLVSPAVLGVVGYLLDITFYYKRRALYGKYVEWWFSLAEMSLTKLHSLVLVSLSRLDATFFGLKLFSFKSCSIVVLLDFIFVLLESIPAIRNANWSPRLDTICLLAFAYLPCILFVIITVRIVIRYTAKWNSPLATSLVALFLFLALFLLNIVLYRLFGQLIYWLPFLEYNQLTPKEQAYTMIGAGNFFSGLQNDIFYFAFTPFYFFMVVGSFIYLAYLSAKFLERFLASQVEKEDAKIFSSAGLLLGIMANIAIFIALPLITYSSYFMSSLDQQALKSGTLDTEHYLLATIENDKKRNTYIKALEELVDIEAAECSTFDPRRENLKDGIKGTLILYSLFTRDPSWAHFSDMESNPY